jgi:hypothetical protein
MNGKTPISGAITYSSSTTTLTATMPYTPTTAGIFQINGSYSGDSNYVSETTPAVNTLTVSGPNFTLTPQPPDVTVTSGNSGTFTVAVTGSDGFNGNVTLTCTLGAQVPGTTCVASPSSVPAGASTTVTVTTTKHQLIPSLPDMPRFGPRAGYPLYVTFVALLLIYAGLFRKRRLFVSAVFAEFCLLIAFVASGCGGGGGGTGSGSSPPATFGPQAGAYNVVITGTSGNITNTASITLIVQ